jgi:hypothetical protein
MYVRQETFLVYSARRGYRYPFSTSRLLLTKGDCTPTSILSHNLKMCIVLRSFLLPLLVAITATSFVYADEESVEEVPDADPFDFDCVGCLENGYYFCHLTALCFAFDLFEEYESDPELLSDFVLPYDCQSSDDFLNGSPDLCSPSENFFSDPMYDTNEWVFDMINIRPVWEKGYFGASVRIRVNDNGFQIDHSEVKKSIVNVNATKFNFDLTNLSRRILVV